MKSDKELRESFKISLKEGDVIELTFLREERNPEDNTRQTELLIKDFTNIVDKYPQKRFRMLADLTPVGSANYVSKKSAELFAKSPVLKGMLKTAIISSSLMLKLLVLTISQTTGKNGNRPLV